MSGRFPMLNPDNPQETPEWVCEPRCLPTDCDACLRRVEDVPPLHEAIQLGEN